MAKIEEKKLDFSRKYWKIYTHQNVAIILNLSEV